MENVVHSKIIGCQLLRRDHVDFPEEYLLFREDQGQKSFGQRYKLTFRGLSPKAAQRTIREVSQYPSRAPTDYTSNSVVLIREIRDIITAWTN